MNRRTVLRNSVLGIAGLSMPNLLFGSENIDSINFTKISNKVPSHYPGLDPEIVGEVVGKSHSNLERVKELVDRRPELARAVWEWRFGDFESAIGAASHVGRRDIAMYLISKGARPSIFTFAMLGNYEVVKSIIQLNPGIQKTMGPHGISLLNHAYTGQRMKSKMTQKEFDNVKRTIDYLEALGDADGKKYDKMSEEEQKKYLGDYKYGSGEKEGFTIAVNMQKRISLAPIGGFGGSLYKVGENKFIYNGAPSVNISFEVTNKKIKSMTIKEPDLTITAKKVS